MKKGYFSLVLHMHIPMVLGHGTWPHGEDWLNEAMAEAYLPTFDVLRRLSDKGILPRITLSLTPVLADQLLSPSFREGFSRYLTARCEAADADTRELSVLTAFLRTAHEWKAFYEGALNAYQAGDFVHGLKRLQDDGCIEIITSAGTHGYLPLLLDDVFTAAQVRAGVATYRRIFDRSPGGMWLPECGYRPSGAWRNPVTGETVGARKGIEEFLRAEGIRYFFADTHMLDRGWKAQGYSPSGRPRTGAAKAKSPHVPYGVGQGGGVAVFFRDPRTSLQVWSREHGYPGEGQYLDFHKRRFPSGLRYWRVTDPKADLGAKDVYRAEQSRRMAGEHARHFIGVVREELLGHYRRFGVPGILVSPFDAELFGHWWFEGPRFLEEVLKGLHEDREIGLITPGDYLALHPPEETISLPEGSWGDGGDSRTWFNPGTREVWEMVYRAEGLFLRIVKERKGSIPAELARELLYLESSDWPFLITARHAADYGLARARGHFRNFMRIFEDVRAGRRPQGDGGEKAVFAYLDTRWWNPSTTNVRKRA